MIKLIVWDLDDTLLNTSNDIVPHTLKRIVEDWQKLSKTFSQDVFHHRREELLPTLSNRDIFKKLSEEFNFPNPSAAYQMAYNHFYHPILDHDFHLLPGAIENLEALKKKGYIQILLTAGDEIVQLKKVEILKIQGLFAKVFVADKSKNNEKDSFFKNFAQMYNLEPKEILSIGNRRQSEIRHAKLAGCRTCLFLFGEHIYEPIEIPADQPDFQVLEHSELIEVCKL